MSTLAATVGTTKAVNLYIVDLLLQIDETGGMVHRDSRPFTCEERARVMTATTADQKAVEEYHRCRPSSIDRGLKLGSKPFQR
jgi:hypothetical protein